MGKIIKHLKVNNTDCDLASINDGELASAITAMNAVVNNKVDKEAGKGLSTNDYTSAEKEKLAGIEAGAQANVIEEIRVNGEPVALTGKVADITELQKTFEAGKGIAISNNIIKSRSVGNISDSAVITLPMLEITSYYICRIGNNAAIALYPPADIPDVQKEVEQYVLFINEGTTDVTITLPTPSIGEAADTITISPNTAREIKYLSTEINEWNYIIFSATDALSVKAPQVSKLTINLSPDTDDGVTAAMLVGCTIHVIDSGNETEYIWNGDPVKLFLPIGDYTIRVTSDNPLAGSYSGVSIAGGSDTVTITVAKTVKVFTTVGTNTFTVPYFAQKMDVFLVGGGSGGSDDMFGQGGRVTTQTNIDVSGGETVTVIVGAGSIGNEYPRNGEDTVLRIGTLEFVGEGGERRFGEGGENGVANPFDPSDTNLYGANGSKGTTPGGKTGGGAAGKSGTFYGAGGGASPNWGNVVYGDGYQGIAKLYFKFN